MPRRVQRTERRPTSVASLRVSPKTIYALGTAEPYEPLAGSPDHYRQPNAGR